MDRFILPLLPANNKPYNLAAEPGTEPASSNPPPTDGGSDSDDDDECDFKGSAKKPDAEKAFAFYEFGRYFFYMCVFSF